MSIRFERAPPPTSTPRAPFADIFTTRIDGTNLTPVTRTPNLDGWPTWGPALTG